LEPLYQQCPFHDLEDCDSGQGISHPLANRTHI
jgi:hypothetical protein